ADKAIAFGVGPFIVTDLVKVALAAAIVPAAWNLVARFRG
ncbi:biotin transporter BioY, partial [Rhizobiaceae sp. 2RAB30]